VYVVFITRVDLYETDKIWINESDYELNTRFIKSISFKIPPLKFEIGFQLPWLGVLDTSGRILLLRINGEFHGSIQHKKIKFTSFAFYGRHIYIGTEFSSIYLYDIGKLRFTDTTYELHPKYAPSYKNCAVSDIQIDESQNVLYYTLSDGTKRFLDLTQKVWRVKESSIQEKYKEKVKTIHCLSQAGNGFNPELSFCTVSKYGNLQKFWKINENLTHKMFYLLQDSKFMSSKITQLIQTDRITCSFMDKVNFQGEKHDFLYLGTK